MIWRVEILVRTRYGWEWHMAHPDLWRLDGLTEAQAAQVDDLINAIDREDDYRVVPVTP